MKGGMKMKTQIKILKHEDKTSKEGKDYTRFNTSKGWYSVFEADIIEDLKKLENTKRYASVEVTESDDGKWKNIRKFYGIGAEPERTEEELEEQADDEDARNFEKMQPEDFGKAKYPQYWNGSKSEPIKLYNPTSMYVSYAKDILVAIMQAQGENKSSASANAMMATAIELVKQAHKEFE